jgi:signal transduction histidine kinase
MMAHEGEIKIESRLGKGTTVSLVFPVFHEDLIV